MIRLSGICKSYRGNAGPIPVLDDISLYINGGEFVCVTGESGSGKSTLLNLLGCLDQAQGGSLTIGDAEPSQMSDSRLTRLRNQQIGFVFQDSEFISYLDIVDNVALPGFYGWDSQSACRKRAALLCDQVGLGHRLKHLPAQLSGGERQRAAVARALFNTPKLLLADEPTGNLDAHNSTQVVKLLKSACESGAAVMMVTHDASLAAGADRVLTLIAGRLMAGRPGN